MTNCSYCGKKEYYGWVAYQKACKSCYNKGIEVLVWRETP